MTRMVGAAVNIISAKGKALQGTLQDAETDVWLVLRTTSNMRTGEGSRIASCHVARAVCCDPAQTS